MQMMSFKIRYEIDHCRSQVHKVRWQYDKVETGYPVLFGLNVAPVPRLISLSGVCETPKIGRPYVGWSV